MKIGVLIENRSVRKFEKIIIEQIMKIAGCEVVVIFNHENPRKQTYNILYYLYETADRFLHKRQPDYINQEYIDFETVEIINFRTRKKGLYDEIFEDDVDKIVSYKLDLILKFNSAELTGPVWSLAEYGVWEYAYGKDRVRFNNAAISEVFAGENVYEVFLQKLPDETNNVYEIDRALISIDPLSLYKTRNVIGWKTHTMMIRNLQMLRDNSEKFIAEKYRNLFFYKFKNQTSPGFTYMLINICKIFYRNILHIIDRVYYKAQWSIYFAENEVDHPFQRDLRKFIRIETPKHLFWADPFVIDQGNKSYIFFEDYVYKTKKGHISVLIYDHNTKTVSDPSIVLDKNYHQSYPFIMEYEGEIYMIPEGSKDKNVKLYKAVEFPYKWEVERTFFEGKEAVDMTMFFYEGRWWLFANMIEEPGQSLNEELYIFYCDDFRTDEWIPHAQNPVIFSVQTSRPAGKIITYNGALYRPSQNSVRGYGYSTNFNRIVKLTPSEYQEEFISEITPDFIEGARAVHTYNSSNKLTVIDCVHKIRRFF